MRQDVEFASGGVECAAWLYLPEGVAKPPVVVMAHGFGGTRRLRLDMYAEVFSGRGMASLVFDYRCQGDSEGYPRQLIDADMQLDDWGAAIRFAKGIEDVDGGRIALWGTSFSGGHVVVTAAREKCVKAVVAQVPFVDSRAVPPERPKAGLVVKFLIAALRDVIGAKLGGEPVYMPVVGPPGSFAFLNTPGSYDTFLEMVPAELGWRNEVTARTIFSFLKYRPILSAADVHCPLMVVPARHDNLIPLKATEKLAEKAPCSTLVMADGGHFDVYAGEQFDKLSAIEADFLAEHLSGPSQDTP